MSYNYDASIILVNYNGKKYIDLLIPSLINLEPSDYTYEIIFVDNASTDESINYLKDKYSDKIPNLKIIESEENLGFAGGNNLGVQHAMGEYVVFLNNDTSVEARWLIELIDKIKSDINIGIVNSKLLFYYDFIRVEFSTIDRIVLSKNYVINGKSMKIDSKFCQNLLYQKEQLVCFGHSIIYIPLIDGICDYLLSFNVLENPEKNSAIEIDFDKYDIDLKENLSIKIKKNDIKDIKTTLVQNAGSGINENYDGYDIGFGQEDCDKYNKEYEIRNACGASIIMLTEDFKKIGMFDERFFMYYEDSDLSYRMKAIGKKLVYCPKSIVRHIHTGSSQEWSPFFLYHVTRNKLLFVYKNISEQSFKKFYRKNIISSIRNRNKIFRIATKDAKKIIHGKFGVVYNPKLDQYKKD